MSNKSNFCPVEANLPANWFIAFNAIQKYPKHMGAISIDAIGEVKREESIAKIDELKAQVDACDICLSNPTTTDCKLRELLVGGKIDLAKPLDLRGFVGSVVVGPPEDNDSLI